MKELLYLYYFYGNVMKGKVLVLLSLMFGFGLHAQNLVVVKEQSDTLAVGNAFTTNDIPSYINLTNVGSAPMDVLVKRIDKNLNNLTDSNAICWQICFNTDVSVSPPNYAITINPGDTTGKEAFVGHVYPDMDGVPMSGAITYVFFDMNNLVDSVSHTVNYEVTTTFDVPEVMQREYLSVYPNPATDNISLEYDLTGLSGTSFELVNVVGNVVYRRNLPGEAGSVDLNISKLNRGIYFYVLRSGKDSILTRKLVVK